MLKLGGMCHCRSTVLKWNQAGERLWQRKRGKRQGATSEGTQADYCIAVDEANSLLYAGGTLVEGEDEGVVYRYSAIDDTPHLDWKSNRDGFTERSALNVSTIPQAASRRRLVIGGDGFLTRVNGIVNPTVLRYNPANGLIVDSANLAGTPTRIWPVPSSSDVIIFNGNFTRYDSGLNVTATASPGATVDGHFDGTVALSVGTGIGAGIRRFNATLGAATHSDNTADFQGSRIVGDGTYAYIRTAGIRRISFGGASPTVDYDNTTGQLSGTGYTGANNLTPIALLGGYMYTSAAKAAAVIKIQKRSLADGSIVWERDVGVSTSSAIYDIGVGGGVVAAVGAWFNGAGSTEPRSIIFLDADSGALIADDAHGVLGVASGETYIRSLYEVFVDSNGNTYACGYID